LKRVARPVDLLTDIPLEGKFSSCTVGWTGKKKVAQVLHQLQKNTVRK